MLGALQEALKRVKAKTTIVRMSEIGLVEMTRKRVRESLGHTLTHACPYCKGRGGHQQQAGRRWDQGFDLGFIQGIVQQ